MPRRACKERARAAVHTGRTRGIGVYEVRDGKVEWKPAIDVTSLAKGGQMLGALVIMCLTLVLVRRRRDE